MSEPCIPVLLSVMDEAHEWDSSLAQCQCGFRANPDRENVWQQYLAHLAAITPAQPTAGFSTQEVGAAFERAVLALQRAGYVDAHMDLLKTQLYDVLGAPSVPEESSFDVMCPMCSTDMRLTRKDGYTTVGLTPQMQAIHRTPVPRALPTEVVALVRDALTLYVEHHTEGSIGGHAQHARAWRDHALALLAGQTDAVLGGHETEGQ